MKTERTIRKNSLKELKKLLNSDNEHLILKYLRQKSSLKEKITKKDFFSYIINLSSEYLLQMGTSFNKKITTSLFNKISKKHPSFDNRIIINFVNKDQNNAIKLLKNKDTTTIFVAPHFSNLDSLVFNYFSNRYNFRNFLIDTGNNLILDKNNANTKTAKLMRASNAIIIDRKLMRFNPLYITTHHLYLKHKLMNSENYLFNLDPGRSYSGLIPNKYNYPGLWKVIPKICNEISNKEVFWIPASLQYQIIPDAYELSRNFYNKIGALPETDYLNDIDFLIERMERTEQDIKSLIKSYFKIILTIHPPIPNTELKKINNNTTLSEKEDFPLHLRRYFLKVIFSSNILFPEHLYAYTLIEKYQLNSKSYNFAINNFEISFNDFLNYHDLIKTKFNINYIIKIDELSFNGSKLFFEKSGVIKENKILNLSLLKYYSNLVQNFSLSEKYEN